MKGREDGTRLDGWLTRMQAPESSQSAEMKQRKQEREDADGARAQLEGEATAAPELQSVSQVPGVWSPVRQHSPSPRFLHGKSDQLCVKRGWVRSAPRVCSTCSDEL